MLPEGFKLSYLDSGITRIVVALNRIPEVSTLTTCEGHVWRDTPFWPTKWGWVHFAKPEGVHEGLVTDIQNYCAKNELFGMSKPYKLSQKSRDYNRTIEAKFEDHQDGMLFDRISEKEQEEYFQRADVRKVELLKGWDDLGEIVENYIMREITKDISSLPFISVE